MSANPDTLISARSVHVALSGRPVIADANLDISAGEFIGLLGPNGAGKTTLLRSLLGLVPAQGDIRVHAPVGYVPQRHEVAWDFPISVFDCVLNGRTGIIGWLRRPGRQDRAAAWAALRHVNLSHLAGRPITELSGGQRQRVLIARALATRPDVLLLDEPFTGLDAPNTEQLLELFAQLCAAGTAVVMSTHNLAEAVHSCERLVLFNRGVVADGPARTIASDPAPWVKTFEVSAHSPLLQAVGVAA